MWNCRYVKPREDRYEMVQIYPSVASAYYASLEPSMTMPHLQNCSHSSYGICLPCSIEYAPPDGWIPTEIPPSDSRRVHLKFADGSEDQGFFWYMEGAWYLSEGSKAKRNQVKPTHWADGTTIREMLSNAVSDDDIGMYA